MPEALKRAAKQDTAGPRLRRRRDGMANKSAQLSPKCALDGWICGISDAGYSRGQQFVVPLVDPAHQTAWCAGGVADVSRVGRTPPVSCHISQLSVVPNASSPRSAGARRHLPWSAAI
jgi:hypothetical protein